MYDNQPISGTGYLDQISPTTQKNSFFDKKPIKIGAIVFGVFVLFIIIVSIIGAMSGKPVPTKQLAARLMTTQSTANDATVNLKSTKIRAYNSNLKLLMTNTIRDATPVFKTEDIDLTKLDKNLIASETNQKMLTNLEDGRLNAIYDRTYAREMAYQLDKVLELMRQIYNSTSNKKLKNFLNTTYDNLSPVQKQFADYNEIN